MKVIQASDHIRLELWPAGHVTDQPTVVIKNVDVEDRDGEQRGVIVYAHEIRHLIDALAEAAVELASPPLFQDNGH